MDLISDCLLVQVTRKKHMEVWKDYNLDEKKLNENIDILEEWCRSQDHLAEALPYLGRVMLERYYIQRRASIEQTKLTIDKALTVRGMIPEFKINEGHKIILHKFSTLLKNVFITFFPQINPIDGTRVLLLTLYNKNFEDIDLIECAKFVSFLLDVRMTHDYIFSDRIIFDLQHLKSSFLTKLNPVILKKITIYFMATYKFQIKGVHVINGPSFFDKLHYVITGFLKEKIVKRIHIHRTYEDLYKYISREILPKDYGGDGMSCDNLIEEWTKYIKSEEGKQILEKCHKFVSDESKRTTCKFDEEYFGLPGSFKQINID